MATIAIAGAGVLGRLLAWTLAQAGHAVQVVDPAPGPDAPATGQLAGTGEHAAGFTAAGMLSPLAELDNAPAEVAHLGWASLQRWQQVAQALSLSSAGGAQPPETWVRQRGSLLLAHGTDLGAAQRVLQRLQAAVREHRAWPQPQPLDRAALNELEPALVPDLKAWMLPGEGQLMPRALLPELARQAPGVRWHWGQRVRSVQPGLLVLDDGRPIDADLAIDARGLGARVEPQPDGSEAPFPLAGLRGVRGELVWLHAPGVVLNRPLRLLHPRHRVYLVPRPGDVVVVGASEVESEDRSPVSLRSAVELMAAAHSVLPALAEARIVHLETNLRPALPDHRPRVQHQRGLLRINGLFRHGWLLAPALVEHELALCGDELAGALTGAAHA